MKTLTQALATVDFPYSAGFLDLMEFVLPHECEFEEGHDGDYDRVRTEHDPNDPGGTTRYGLDATSHPHVDIDALTLDAACHIYFEEIWQPLQCEKMDDDIAIALCDAAINCGAPRAARWLQSIVKATPDGNIGPKTLDLINGYNSAHALAMAFNARRMQYYQTEVRPALQHIYLAGWENRMTDLNKALA